MTGRLPKSFVCLVLLWLGLTLSWAQSPSRGTDGAYWGVRLGYLEVEEVDEGNLIGGLVLGLRPSRHIALEGSLDFSENELVFRQGFVQGSVLFADRETFAAQASLLLYPVPGRRIRPYLSGGVGWFYSRYTSPRFTSDTNSDGGFSAGFGFDAIFGGFESFEINWDARWLFTQKEEFAENQVEPDGLMVTLGFKYHF